MDLAAAKRAARGVVHDPTQLKFQAGADEIAARSLEDTIGAALTATNKSFSSKILM